ncbi:amidohydrolase family protein [Microbispora sp. NPDC049125]|uniref:amidohydrolase family protein n=1 Tax=Microbispora sp. NPDC049125 TaxID=3154929 RepID=UPI0034676CD4
MIDGMFVIDATVHAYNLEDRNLRSPDPHTGLYSYALREMLWKLHERYAPDGHRIPQSAFFTDWSPESLARTLFLESDIDMAVHHRLRIDSLFDDGLVRGEKNRELAERWPERFVIYAGVNPLDGIDACLRDLREQVEAIPETIGLKLYPTSGSPDASWRLDDPEFAPLFELAVELGLKVIAVHKVVPNGLVPMKPFGIDDLEVVAVRYPLLWEIVHAGLPPFVEEVSLALMRYPNVYANLEISSALLQGGVGYVQDALAQFISLGGAEKIFFSTGANHFHPQPIVKCLAELQFPQQTLDRYGLDQITREQRQGILGANYASVVGLDLEAAGKRIADDEFARARAGGPPLPAWSSWSESEPAWAEGAR